MNTQQQGCRAIEHMGMFPTDLFRAQPDTEIPFTYWQFAVAPALDCFQHEVNQETHSSMRNNKELPDQCRLEPNRSAKQSIEMLKAVVNGDTYEEVATRFAKSRTAVERRIKTVAAQLTKAVGIHGLSEDGTAFVSRLRMHRDAILTALEAFDPDALQQST